MAWGACVIISLGGCSKTEQPRAPCGHAHNDYAHARPLFDALDRGFCSVEADIHLVGGALLVAHELNETDPSRTLQSLYLDPLRQLFERDDARVSTDGRLILLVDQKSDGPTTYAALDAVLAGYADMLTSWEGGVEHHGAVTVILSGERPHDIIAAQPLRRVAIDGRIGDLESTEPESLMPLVSDDWFHYFSWTGDEPIPDFQKQRLASFVRKAHALDRRLRFWNAPERSEVWSELVSEGVDLLNADDLDALSAFLRSQSAR